MTFEQSNILSCVEIDKAEMQNLNGGVLLLGGTLSNFGWGAVLASAADSWSTIKQAAVDGWNYDYNPPK